MGTNVFEDLERELRRMEQGTRLSLAFALDEDRFLERLCPNEECGARFKVQYDDLDAKVNPEAFFCPICGLAAKATEWNTPEQMEYMKGVALREIQRQLGAAFENSAHSFSRPRRSDGFITMTMSYKPTSLPILFPPEASDVMRQQTTCEACGMRYASVGAAFFCPACGHNSAASTFDSSVETVTNTLEAIPHLHAAMVSAIDADTGEDAIRHIRENALVKLVSSFQRLAEALFDTVLDGSDTRRRRNVFQNLSESSGLWRDAIGLGYEDMLPASDLVALERFFQQRHLLSHKDGIVDQQYVERSGDTSYAVGQRLVVRSDAVADLAALIQRLAGELRSRVRDA